MKGKKIIMRIIIALVATVTVGAMIAYFVLASSRPWMALFIAFCGLLIDINLLAAFYIVNKNFKK